jgi:hypothetical protein
MERNNVARDPNCINCLSTNSSYLCVFLLCQKHDPYSLYLGAMITRMGAFIRSGYGSETGIAASTLIVTHKCQNHHNSYVLQPKKSRIQYLEWNEPMLTFLEASNLVLPFVLKGGMILATLFKFNCMLCLPLTTIFSWS